MSESSPSVCCWASSSSFSWNANVTVGTEGLLLKSGLGEEWLSAS